MSTPATPSHYVGEVTDCLPTPRHLGRRVRHTPSVDVESGSTADAVELEAGGSAPAVAGRVVRDRRTWAVIGLACGMSVLVRLPMLSSPVSVDEGGYLAIARGWAHGQVLYRDVFVDRPQGLLALFRVWDWLSGGNTRSIHLMAMLFGIVLVVSTAVVVREVAGDTAARLAAMVCAVVSAAPMLEGFAANTELLSGALSAAGLAVGVVGWSKRRPLRWFFTAGLCSGLALSLKQSGFDGLAALLGWLLLVAVFGTRARATALKAIAAAIAGLTAVLTVLVVHGALTGWSRWWAAVAGYRLRTQSAFASADWHNLAATMPYAFIVLGTVALTAVLGAESAAQNLTTRLTTADPGPLILLFWLIVAIIAFLLGGGFWRHYWLLLAAPLSALAGIGLAKVPKFRYLAMATVLAPSLISAGWVYSTDRAHLNIRAAADHHAAVDEQVAKWFDSHRQPGQNLYVLCASAGAYADAHQDPGYPYLWFVEVHHAPHAQNLLVAYLNDTINGPHYIAEYERASTCDSSGRVEQILNNSFTQVALIGSIPIFERNPSPP